MKKNYKEHLLICYDIENDKNRRLLSKLLDGYGFRVQKSVYEIYIEVRELSKLKVKLVSLYGETDSIRMYDLEHISAPIVYGQQVMIYDGIVDIDI